MNFADVAVLGSLALIAGLPVIPWALARLRGVLRPAGLPAPSPSRPESPSPRQQWVQTLLALQAELEADPSQQAAVSLCRQLVWLLIGGAPGK